MDNPVFILGAHKSGTSLLRSLLDGHSSLFVVPVEEHLFKHFGYSINYPYQYQVQKRYTDEEIKENFFNWIKTCNNSSDEYGDSVAKGLLDVDQFREALFSNETGEKRQLATCYFESIYFALTGEKLVNKNVVTKSVENAELALETKQLYPNAKFIHIVRNPYASFVALRKYKTKNGRYPMVYKLLKALQNNYYYLEKNQRLIDDYHVVSYEDLLLKPEQTMRNIADYIGIEYDNHLVTPTFLGELWQGNSTSDKKFNGIDTAPIKNWENEIFPYEVFLINNMFPHVLEEFNYERIDKKSKGYQLMKGENILRYFFNRLYKYYLPISE